VNAPHRQGDRASIFDLRHGRWQDVFADVAEVDALVADPPYGNRTHAGHDSGAAYASSAGGYTAKSGRKDSRKEARSALGYEPMTEADVAAYVAHWHPRVRGWIAVMSCTDLAGVWRDALDSAGRMTFAPIPVVDPGSRVRLTGDGPSNWSVMLNVARPRTKAMARWGTLPGFYRRRPGDERSERMGGKPLGVMREIVRDYSRPGDLVLDTHAGGGTTLLAAMLEGRRAIGAEVDESAYHDADERCRPHVERCAAMLGITSGRTLDLFT
jgi:hypothetical protein